MSFHLRISTQRDPTSTSAVPEQRPRCRIATFQITGELSQPDRQKLQNQVQALAPSEAETIIIDLLDVSAADQIQAQHFCDWITRLRGEGKPLHVAARQADVYRLLNELGGQPEWLMPFSGVVLGVRRKAISFEGLNPSAKKPSI